MPVGLCIDRGPEMVIALLGILKAGGAYVPLDQRLPDERLRFMVEDVRPRVVLTKQNLWREPFGKDAIILDGSWATIAAGKYSEYRERVQSAKSRVCDVHIGLYRKTERSSSRASGRG